MAQLVFRLKYVPEEEADDIRQLLTDNDIEFYETQAGRWQISMAGLWVRDKDQAQQARELIEEDQRQRAISHANLTPWDWFSGFFTHAKQNPVEFLFTLAAILFVLGLSLFPFLL